MTQTMTVYQRSIWRGESGDCGGGSGGASTTLVMKQNLEALCINVSV